MKDTTKQKILELVPDAKEDFGLAVVLRAIEKHNRQTSTVHSHIAVSVYGEFYDSGEKKVLGHWNLEHDDYDKQSDPTKQFISSLLGV